jgi:hypothetical protein
MTDKSDQIYVTIYNVDLLKESITTLENLVDKSIKSGNFDYNDAKTGVVSLLNLSNSLNTLKTLQDLYMKQAEKSQNTLDDTQKKEEEKE